MKALIPAIFATLMVLAAPAWAGIGRDGAAELAQRASGGRVLSVDKADAEGRPAWRLKVLTGQGEVRVIRVDAASGRTF